MLLVEDELSIAEPLVAALRREGHVVTHAADGASALAAPLTSDVVLLDLRLPDMDGFDVCRGIRARSTVPIIIVSARGEELDKVLGLELGADDYLVKPFGVRELIARMNAVTRRSASAEQPVEAGSADQTITIGDLTIDTRAHRVLDAGADVDLTPTEFDLLCAFAGHPGAARSRDQLMLEVWQTSWAGSTKTVDVHVAALRRKLGTSVRIETVRGIGYRMVDGS